MNGLYSAIHKAAGLTVHSFDWYYASGTGKIPETINEKMASGAVF